MSKKSKHTDFESPPEVEEELPVEAVTDDPDATLGTMDEPSIPPVAPLPEGVRFIEKYKKYHAEVKVSGQVINLGLCDTLAQAEKKIAEQKAAVLK